MSHSTNSLPGAHFLINRPDTFRSLRQPVLSDNNNDLNAHPILAIAGLGDYVQGLKETKKIQLEIF